MTRKDVPALFARFEFGPPVSPLNDMSQIGAATEVLREIGPCDLTTSVVEMLERGYVPVTDPQTLRKSIRVAFLHKPSVFHRDDGIWSILRAVTAARNGADCTIISH